MGSGERAVWCVRHGEDEAEQAGSACAGVSERGGGEREWAGPARLG